MSTVESRITHVKGRLSVKGDHPAERREACSNQAFAASLSRMSRMTIVKA
jgi:hypothetical protein